MSCHGVPGLEFRCRESGQKIRNVASASCRLSRGRLASQPAALIKVGLGSVVGIHFEVAGMYTGTLITDLMATVELAERRVERSRVANDQELYAIFAMQVPIAEGDQVFMGAA